MATLLDDLMVFATKTKTKLPSEIQPASWPVSILYEWGHSE